MGVDTTRKPPLPAPTDCSSYEPSMTPTELATNVSRVTDRTSYSIPDDGSPITISTGKTRGESNGQLTRAESSSRNSLLIEYYETGKRGDKSHSRPSVRVKVTPSSRKGSKEHDHVRITETGKDRTPSSVRRISLGKSNRERALEGTEVSAQSGDSQSTNRPPVEVEVLANHSDLSGSNPSRRRSVNQPSDISSMPPDSMLEGAVIHSPPRRRSRSSEREDVDTTNSLKVPARQRSRSPSRERMIRKVMEKIPRQREDEYRDERRRIVERSVSQNQQEGSRSGGRNSITDGDEDALYTGTDSSLLTSQRSARLKPGDQPSNRSGTAKPTIANPRLLETVEDAIRRLIMPELEALKSERKTQQNQSKFDQIPLENKAVSHRSENEELGRKLSKHSSAPNVSSKPKAVLNRDVENSRILLSPDIKDGRAKLRKPNKDLTKSSQSGRRASEESSLNDGELEAHRKSRRESSSDNGRFQDDASGNLTAEALRHHDSRSSRSGLNRHERREKRSRSGSRRSWRAKSYEETQYPSEIPRLPMQGGIQDSELTRESILSANTGQSFRETSTHVRDVPVEVPNHCSPISSTRTRTPTGRRRDSPRQGGGVEDGQGILKQPSSDRPIILSRKDVDEPDLEHDAMQPTRARGASPVQSAASYEERDPRAFEQQETSQGTTFRSLRDRNPSMDMRDIPGYAHSPPQRASTSRQSGSDGEIPFTYQGGDHDPAADDFYKREHERNEEYRASLDFVSRDPDSHSDYEKRYSGYTADTADSRASEKVLERQHLNGIEATPEYVHANLTVESAVASLHDPSVLGSSVSGPHRRTKRSYDSRSSLNRHVQEQPKEGSIPQAMSDEGSPISRHWSAIREQAAKSLSPNDSPAKYVSNGGPSRSDMTEEEIPMVASGLPILNDPLPEIGHYEEEFDSNTTPSDIQSRRPRNTWAENRSVPSQDSLDERGPERYDARGQQTPDAAVMGTAATVGLGTNINQGERAILVETPPKKKAPTEVEDTGRQGPIRQRFRSATIHDEGYMSSAPGALTPEPYGKVADNMDAAAEGDPFGISKRRHPSHDSHGMDSPLYDSATGKGIDRIESRDVVALMDHLTVRDAQRNARDTEMLVTLVRTAAEMRNSFDDIRRFIIAQDQLITANADKNADQTVRRILQGPRPQPVGSPRVSRSQASQHEDAPAKRKNVFKRALQGLSGRSSNDLANIESMLMELLDGMEDLKDMQGAVQQPVTGRSSRSMDSYEHLRAAPESGYEPDNHTGASTPNQSGRLSGASAYNTQPSGMRSATPGTKVLQTALVP